jgi:hypothetical protein
MGWLRPGEANNQPLSLSDIHNGSWPGAMSNTPIDLPLLLILGLLGVLFWFWARRETSSDVWRRLWLGEKLVWVCLSIAAFVIVIYSRLIFQAVMRVLRAVIDLLFDLLRVG